MAIIATPSIFVDKLLYETKIQIKASVFTAGVIVLLVALVRSGAPVPVLALMLLFFIPIAIVTPTVAYKLGTLHSMLKFMGLTRDFDNEGMVSEVIKTSFVQIPGYAILTAIIGGVLYLNFGLDYFLVLFQDPEAFFDAESLNLLEGKVPAFIIANVLYFIFLPLLNAVYAVPMAAAAYGLDPRRQSFNGVWGIGYRGPMIFLTTFIWTSVLIIISFLVLDLVTQGSLLQILFNDLSGDQQVGGIQFVDPLPSYMVFAFIALVLLQLIIGTNLLAACSGMALREKLDEEERERAKNMSKNDGKGEEHLAKVISLRKDRMPSRHK